MVMVDSSISWYLQKISVLLDFPILSDSSIGNILCIIVFLGLQRFEKSSYSFCLIFACFVSVFKLVVGLFPGIFINLVDVPCDLLPIYYKFITSLCEFCTSHWLMCVCFITSGRYLRMSIGSQCLHLTSLKMVYRIMGIAVFMRIMQYTLYTLAWTIDADGRESTTSFFMMDLNKIHIPILLGIISVLTMNLLTVPSIFRILNHKNNHESTRIFNKLSDDIWLMLSVHFTCMVAIYKLHMDIATVHKKL